MISLCVCIWLFTSRTCASPVKRTTKRLFTEEDTTDDNGDGFADSAASTAEPRYLLASVYDYVFMQTPIKHYPTAINRCKNKFPTTVQARVCLIWHI